MRYILASASARRQQFLKDLGIDFELRLSPTDESYPPELQGAEIPMYIAQQKAIPLLPTLKKEEVLITADTLIWFEGEAIGKPKDYADAFQTLSRFSGHSHEDTTLVTFANLTPEMIDYCLTHYQPYAKAGSYGIQEWIGAVGITSIQGSYNNVVGFPTQLFWEQLKLVKSEK